MACGHRVPPALGMPLGLFTWSDCRMIRNGNQGNGKNKRDRKCSPLAVPRACQASPWDFSGAAGALQVPPVSQKGLSLSLSPFIHLGSLTEESTAPAWAN